MGVCFQALGLCTLDEDVTSLELLGMGGVFHGRPYLQEFEKSDKLKAGLSVNQF